MEKGISMVGIVVPGMGMASRALSMQWERLKATVPEIAACKQATINVWLDRPLFIGTCDRTTDDFEWNRGVRERFGFVEIGLSLAGRDQVRAWIYRPSGSFNRFMPNLVDVIAPPISGLRPGTECVIVLSRPVVEKPFAVVG